MLVLSTLVVFSLPLLLFLSKLLILKSIFIRKLAIINEQLLNGYSFSDPEISDVDIAIAFEESHINEKKLILDQLRSNSEYNRLIDSYYQVVNKNLLYAVISFGGMGIMLFLSVFYPPSLGCAE